MRNVLLVCSAGMSNSLLMTKMREYADSIGYEISVEAHPVSTVNETGKTADVILLGPQIRFNLNKVKGMYPDKPVEAMDIQAYGTMNGQKIVEHVKQLLGD